MLCSTDRRELEATLSLASLETGPGVDEGAFEQFLRRLQEYTGASTARGAGAGALSGLRGLRVRVGRYLGVADDGACILPWDLFEDIGKADDWRQAVHNRHAQGL